MTSEALDERPSPDEPERRVNCPLCGASIVQGARKCRECRRWLGPRSEQPPPRIRSLVALMAIVAGVGALFVSQRPTPVGEAPPLTPLASGSASADPVSSSDPAPLELGPSAWEPQQPEAPSAGPPSDWRARHIRVDVHPLDAVFSDDGATIYVSGDDANLRAYEVASGKLVHIMPVPAQGDRLELLNGRYLAVIRTSEAAHIPIVDVHSWERDAILLHVGADPADIVPLPDGKTVITASRKGRRLSWFELGTGRQLGELRLPHSPDQLYLLHGHERQYLGAIGRLHQGDTPTSASLELFDPSERPFGATRRSVSIGRDPHAGAVSADGKTLFIADRVSNSAWLFKTEATTRPTPIAVGHAPVAAFIVDYRFGVTLDGEARTATVVDLESAKRTTTLMLPGSPSFGAVSPDGKRLFVSLGGSWPPTGSGLAIIAGSPPQVIARRQTAAGAGRIAISRDGSRAAVACYSARELTVFER